MFAWSWKENSLSTVYCCEFCNIFTNAPIVKLLLTIRFCQSKESSVNCQSSKMLHAIESV